jgi:hypothetical protein
MGALDMKFAFQKQEEASALRVLMKVETLHVTGARKIRIKSTADLT